MAEIIIEDKQNTLWNITVDGEKKTALATGIPNRVFQGTDMSRLRSLPGYIWNGGVREWAIEGMGEQEGQIIFWGERLELVPIDPSAPFSARELSGLGKLFMMLRDKSEKPAFSGDSFFRLREGGLFCFPIYLMEFIHSRQSRELLMSREIYNHPDLSGEQRLSHTLAILAFQGLTGRLPYTRTDGYEWIHEEMRKKKLPSLTTAGPGADDLRKAADKALNREFFPSLEEWRALLDGDPELPGTMTEPFALQLEKRDNGFVKSFGRRKNQVKITLAVVGAAVILWIGAALLKNYREPPYTWEMAPREVVTAFYDGINALDTTAVDGTVEKAAGKEISNQVATMFVMSKNRQAYGQALTISPETWKEQGYEELAAGTAVFGIGDLTIKDLGGNRFEASYLAWYPATGDPEQIGASFDPYEIYARKDILTVIRDKRDRAWIIGNIDRVKDDPVPSSRILGK